jgi:methylmalonyl-CoA mutase
MQATDLGTHEQQRWHQLVTRALKGAPFESLQSTSDEGILLQPLYAAGHACSIAMRGGGVTWRIAQRVDHPDPLAAQTQVMAELEGGTQALVLVARGAAGGFGYGIDLAALPHILADVEPASVRLMLEPSPARARDARALAALLADNPTNNASIEVDFGLDPASVLAATGGLRGDSTSAPTAQGRHFEELAAHGFKGTIFRADGRVIHDGGGSDSDELGFVLAGLLLAMRSLQDSERAARASLLCVSVDGDQFAGIAKLRALRLLHAALMEACGIAPFAPTIHAQTSARMLTRLDPHVNMLRTTSAVFAAAIGGADGITALPFTLPLGYPDAFARRNARNTQLVLQAEARLHEVEDPAAGSGLFECYTQALCQKAWAAFQAIEAEGGVLTSLAGGHIQTRVQASRDARRAQIEDGQRHLTGSTIFQLEQPYPVDVEPVARMPYPHKSELKLYGQAIALEPLDGTVWGEA